MAAGMVSSVWLERDHSTVKLYYKLGHTIVCFVFRLSTWICDFKKKRRKISRCFGMNIFQSASE